MNTIHKMNKIDSTMEEFDKRFDGLKDSKFMVWNVKTKTSKTLHKVIRNFLKTALQSAVKNALESTRLEKKNADYEKQRKVYKMETSRFIIEGRRHGWHEAVQTQDKLIKKTLKQYNGNV